MKCEVRQLEMKRRGPGRFSAQFEIMLFPESEKDQENLREMHSANLIASAGILQGKFEEAKIILCEADFPPEKQ